MRNPFDKLGIAVLLSLASWALVFVELLGTFELPALITPWLQMVLIALAVILAVRSSRPTGPRFVVVAAGTLVFLAGISLIAVHRDADDLRRLWRRHEARSTISMLQAVGERVQSLQALSTGLGNQASTFILERERTMREDSTGLRLEAFGLLESQATRVRNGGELPPGTEIGIQLFDKNGKRFAWAGWPQSLFPQDHRFVASGKTLLYSRQVSLYQILTHIIPISNNSGERVATLAIDMPLEVNYKVNNKFLKSTSFVDNIAQGSAANVRFDYAPTMPNLPYTIDNAEKNLRAREAEIGRIKESGRAADGDSLLNYAGFPAIVRPFGEIHGDESAGLTGRALVHSKLGNPLFTITITSRPFRYFLDNYKSKNRARASVLILLALIVYFVFSLRVFPPRLAGPAGVTKAIYLIGFFLLIRYWGVWLLPVLFDSQHKLFDPAVFATPILGGLMRSAGDLMITSVFFVIALYGALKITRASIRTQRPSPIKSSSWLFVIKGALAAVALFGTFELSRRFVHSVVVNANPRLVGETMKLFESYAVMLHLSTFLMMSGIFLAGMICVWGLYRMGSRMDATRSSLAAVFVIVVVSLFAWDWQTAFLVLLLLLFVVFAPRIIQREDLVSIVLAAFCFVIIVSAVAYLFLNDNYQALRRTFIQERVSELTDPSDNWKVFILEDVLERFSQDNSIRETLRRGESVDVQRLAFDLWAGSSLSLLGYSSAIHVFNEHDSLISRFTVEMPYRVKVAEATERLETVSSQEWVVLDLTTSTPGGKVRFYRGIVNIRGFGPTVLGAGSHSSTGKVVVDIPFFFESLAWASRTGPQTPEVLRNVQEGGIEPRLEETEVLLLARLKGTRVVESSSDVLPAGFAFPESELDKAMNLEWPVIKTANAPYRFLVQESEERGNYLLAGFPVPGPLQHLLRWSTILSLYFFFTVAIIVLIIVLKSLPFLRAIMPTLTPGRRLGFQQKLLVSFLIIALLPSIILGVFSIRLIKERFVEENRKEALYKSFSARKSLSNLLIDELNYLLDHSDLRELVSGDIPRSFLRDKTRSIEVFVDTGDPVGTYERVVVGGKGNDNQTQGGAGVDAVDWDVAALLERFSTEQVFIHGQKEEPRAAVLSGPFSFKVGEAISTFMVYYARRVDGQLLGEIADQIGADINVYDKGELIATSREGLLFGGFISSMMNADAYVKVSLMRVDQSLVTERAGRYRYEVAYLPVQTATRDESGAIGLPLLFRPESYHVEVQKASSIVLSIFALLSAATMGLGLLLARGIFEPLKGLLEGTKRISRGDLTFKLPALRSDEIGTVVEAFNEMTDQLLKSQNALEERRRYLEVILANIGTGVISTDADDRIRAVNNAAERILNLRSADVMQKSADELVQHDVVPEFFAILARGSSQDEPFVSSEIDITADGRTRTIKYMRTRLSTDGRYLGTVYVFEDLTELINSKKLSAWVEMARQIAHEIKNPLTPIKLSAQFMVKAHEEKAEDFNTIFKEGSDTIIHQVEVLRHIASEFSSFGRLQQLDLVSHALAPQIEDMVAPYRKNTAGIEVALRCEEQNLRVLVDSEALRKICTNLIENAMEAMPNGGRLDITCSRAMHQGQEHVMVSFRDTGSGLTDDVKQKLFEPYFSTKTTGTGLGLAICRTLSREMGGDVVVTNVEKEKGVSATLYLKPA
ncbi:MAG: ATP-binding protein [Candidatus Krumholzibacteria bacterium]|nr:ATP-binding protein [Candidatus Krumholzibacteria bacterium]